MKKIFLLSIVLVSMGVEARVVGVKKVKGVQEIFNPQNPSAKITCPCSCQCPEKITIQNGVRHCPTECLLSTKDGTTTPKGL